MFCGLFVVQKEVLRCRKSHTAQTKMKANILLLLIKDFLCSFQTKGYFLPVPLNSYWILFLFIFWAKFFVS